MEQTNLPDNNYHMDRLSENYFHLGNNIPPDKFVAMLALYNNIPPNMLFQYRIGLGSNFRKNRLLVYRLLVYNKTLPDILFVLLNLPDNKNLPNMEHIHFCLFPVDNYQLDNEYNPIQQHRLFQNDMFRLDKLLGLMSLVDNSFLPDKLLVLPVLNNNTLLDMPFQN